MFKFQMKNSIEKTNLPWPGYAVNNWNNKANVKRRFMEYREFLADKVSFEAKQHYGAWRLLLEKCQPDSVLDFGAGFGVYGALARPIPYVCVEVPIIVNTHGCKFEDLSWCDNLESLGENKFDLVMASSSIQYFHDWKAALRILALRSERLLYLPRMRLINGPSCVMLQTYDNEEYFCWDINEQELGEYLLSLGFVPKFGGTGRYQFPWLYVREQ